MSASYWNSTQRRYWTYKKPELAAIRKQLEDQDRALLQQYPLPERRHLNIYFSHQLSKLGRALSVRQQAHATAQIYIRRFYTRIEIRRTNPYLLMATALYLACKMEECPQHIRLVVAEAHKTWPELPLSDPSKLGECEFTLISEMSSQLIVHHPYRSLAELQQTFALTRDENNLAWSIINDSLLTDLPLLYPPHTIAVTAMFLAVVIRPSQSNLQLHAASVGNALQQLGSATAAQGQQGSGGNNSSPGVQNRIQKLVQWLAESSVDIEAVVDCTQELISLYEVWESYNDKVCKEQIGRFVKARGLDK